MTSARLLYGNIRSGLLQGELPILTAEAEWVVNAPGSLRATIALDDVPTADGLQLAPRRTALHLMEGGIPTWSGVLWTRRINVSDGTVELGAEGWLSYFRHRYLTVPRNYVQEDQATIAADLVDWAQTVYLGDVGVLSFETVTPTGVLRDRAYVGSPVGPSIGTLLENLGALEDGFQFAFTPSLSSGPRGVVVALTTRYPYVPAAGPLILEDGVNVDELEWTSDGTEAANVVVSEGSGTLPTTATVVADADLGQSPRLEWLLSDSDLTTLGAVQAAARARLATDTAPRDVLRATLGGTADPPRGSYAVGDVLRVRGPLGLDTAALVESVRLELDGADDTVSMDLLTLV